MLARRQTVLAFDVGIKNMAMCLMRSGAGEPDRGRTVERPELTFEVLDLKKFSVGEWGTSQQKLVLTMCNKLNDMAFERVPDYVVIENQLANCSTLRVLQFALQSYFHGRYSAIPVRFQDGECKLKMCDQEALNEEKREGKNKYRTNKKYALLQAQADLEGTCWRALVTESKKADDLADAYLHALFFLKHRV